MEYFAPPEGRTVWEPSAQFRSLMVVSVLERGLAPMGVLSGGTSKEADAGAVGLVAVIFGSAERVTAGEALVVGAIYFAVEQVLGPGSRDEARRTPDGFSVGADGYARFWAGCRGGLSAIGGYAGVASLFQPSGGFTLALGVVHFIRPLIEVFRHLTWLFCGGPLIKGALMGPGHSHL